MRDFLGGFTWGSEDSFDSVLEKKKVDLKKVASLDDLTGFIRISNDTLINKANRDLWRVEEDDEGNLLVYRLFDSNESLLKA